MTVCSNFQAVKGCRRRLRAAIHAHVKSFGTNLGHRLQKNLFFWKRHECRSAKSPAFLIHLGFSVFVWSGVRGFEPPASTSPNVALYQAKLHPLVSDCRTKSAAHQTEPRILAKIRSTDFRGRPLQALTGVTRPRHVHLGWRPAPRAANNVNNLLQAADFALEWSRDQGAL